MASSGDWRNLAEQFRAIPNGWAMMAILNLNPERNGLRWELAGERGSLDEFRILAMRAGKEIANVFSNNLLDAWLNLLRERDFGFKAAQPVLGINRNGSGPRHYLPGTIYDLPRESVRLCRVLEASAMEAEFKEKQRAITDDSPQSPTVETEIPPAKIKPAKRFKKQDLSRYFDAASLTDKQYECASLHWEFGIPKAQIARELGLHRKTVDQHLQAASAKMRSSGGHEKMRKASSKFKPEE
jgi:DNA-binding CsgD family transcriptional regulator